MGVFSEFEHVVREKESLAPYTWFRLGGAAEYFAEPTTPEELAALVKRAHDEGLPVRVLGGGSNLLVRDEGVPGLVLHLGAASFGNISRAGNRLRAGGGAKLGHVISSAVREGLAGLEMLVGIPGSVGGALHTNADAHSSDIGQATAWARVMTRKGEILERPRSELLFGYRASNLDELVILEAAFDLEPGDPRLLTKRMQQLWILKRAGLPLSDQNTGCIFKDSASSSAAALIDQAGLKGLRVGEAEISDRDSNFIVVGRGGKASDVLQLIELIRTGVRQRCGADLELALEVW